MKNLLINVNTIDLTGKTRSFVMNVPVSDTPLMDAVTEHDAKTFAYYFISNEILGMKTYPNFGELIDARNDNYQNTQALYIYGDNGEPLVCRGEFKVDQFYDPWSAINTKEIISEVGVPVQRPTPDQTLETLLTSIGNDMNDPTITNEIGNYAITNNLLDYETNTDTMKKCINFALNIPKVKEKVDKVIELTKIGADKITDFVTSSFNKSKDEIVSDLIKLFGDKNNQVAQLTPAVAASVIPQTQQSPWIIPQQFVNQYLTQHTIMDDGDKLVHMIILATSMIMEKVPMPVAGTWRLINHTGINKHIDFNSNDNTINVVSFDDQGVARLMSQFSNDPQTVYSKVIPMIMS